MELLRNYVFLVYRHKFMILLCCIAAVSLAVKLTKKLPEKLSSRARLATGLVDQNQVEFLESKSDAGETQINMQFGNLIQSMQLRKIYDQISYLLLMHDIDPKVKPFKKLSGDLLTARANPDTLKHIMATLKKKYAARESLLLFDPFEKSIDKLLMSMGHDYESLKKTININRLNSSDFINIEVESNNPLHAAFLVNTVCSEYLAYYNEITKENHIKGVNLLETLMLQKRDAMNQKMQILKDYKIKNRILNLSELANSVFTQLSDYEQKKEQTEKEIVSISKTIEAIDGMFDPKDRAYMESTLIRINQEIISTKEVMRSLQENYIKSNFDNRFKVRLDSMRSILTAQITQLTDKYIVNPLATKEALVSKRLDLRIQLEIAKNSLSSYEKKIAQLTVEYDKLVPHEAVIQTMETEIDIASKEYIEILQKYNQSSMKGEVTVKLKQIELGMPGPPAPSKKTFLVALAGIIPAVVYLLVLFVIFYLDDSLKNAKDLANKTEIPVMGYLPLLTGDSVNLDKIWKNEENTPESAQYKDLLRSIRFETEEQMAGKKSLVVTSLAEMEGKTFVAISLAFACKLANRKVLLIDGDFDVHSTTDILKPTYFLEDYLMGGLSPEEISSPENNLAVLGNRGGDTSIFEFCDNHLVKEKLEAIENRFNIVIIDCTALNNMNKAKEWIVLGKKVLSVFEANQSITPKKDLVINYLREQDERFIGWALNKVAAKKTRLGKLMDGIKAKRAKAKKSKKNQPIWKFWKR